LKERETALLLELDEEKRNVAIQAENMRAIQEQVSQLISTKSHLEAQLRDVEATLKEEHLKSRDIVDGITAEFQNRESLLQREKEVLESESLRLQEANAKISSSFETAQRQLEENQKLRSELESNLRTTETELRTLQQTSVPNQLYQQILQDLHELQQKIELQDIQQQYISTHNSAEQVILEDIQKSYEERLAQLKREATQSASDVSRLQQVSVKLTGNLVTELSNEPLNPGVRAIEERGRDIKIHSQGL